MGKQPTNYLLGKTREKKRRRGSDSHILVIY